MGFPGKLSLGTQGLNSGGSLLRMHFWKQKSSPFPYIRNPTEEAGNQHGWARTCWSNWGKRRMCTGSWDKYIWCGKNAGVPSRHAEMGSGKPKHRWNWTWWGMWKITRDSTGTSVRKDRKRRVCPSDKWEGRTGFSSHGGSWGTQQTSVFTASQPSRNSRVPDTLGRGWGRNIPLILWYLHLPHLQKSVWPAVIGAPIVWRVMLTELLVFGNRTMKCVLNRALWFRFYILTFRVPVSEAGEWQWLCWTARSFLQWDMGEHLLQSYVSTHCSNCMQTLELWRRWGNWKRFQIWQRFWAHVAGSHWVRWATQLSLAMSVRPLGSSVMWYPSRRDPYFLLW